MLKSKIYIYIEREREKERKRGISVWRGDLSPLIQLSYRCNFRGSKIVVDSNHIRNALSTVEGECGAAWPHTWAWD